MAIDFRCENCGKLLSVDAEESSKIKCPYCKAKVVVPAGLASLPRPHVPGGADSRPDQPVAAEVEEEVLVSDSSDALMGVMAMLMPWVISLFFHAGVLVILVFIMIVTSKTVLKASTVPQEKIPLSETLSENIGGRKSPELTAKSFQRADTKWAQRDSRIPSAALGRTKSKISIYGSMGGAAGGGGALPGLMAGGGEGPKSRFFGTGGNAYHIVYVVDRSGSMLETFDQVRKEIIKSISKLNRQQTFHVIFFATGKPKENPPHRLVFATQAKKLEALKFLETINSEGQTDPVRALKKAFAVLNRTPGSRKGKLIYLLTDGEFPDNEKVLREIRTMNAKGEIHINTILHHHRSPDVMKVLQQIASENKGTFKFVEPTE